MDNLSYIITPIEVGRLRIVINKGDQELGSLYYEKAKKTFNRKPIGMNAWGCVDAKIEGLYEMGGDFTPLDILNRCQQLLSSPAGQDTVDTDNKPTEE